MNYIQGKENNTMVEQGRKREHGTLAKMSRARMDMRMEIEGFIFMVCTKKHGLGHLT